MEQKKDNTEEKILDAAHQVFLHKGMDGARMQEIADNAGINKALLHYYFRTKQKLFEAIFAKAFKHSFPKIRNTLLAEMPFTDKVQVFIDSYINLLLKNPYLPTFILRELQRDPDTLAKIIKDQGLEPELFFEPIIKEMEAGKIRRMDPRHLIVNVIALSIFPFAGRPLMQIVIFKNDKKAYNKFLQERKEVVKEFVLNAIKV